MAGGYHNGFNPFRDAHGRWATPGGAGVEHAQQPSKGSGNMNDVIRGASGRATGGASGGGGGGGGSKGGDTAATVATHGATGAGESWPHDGDGLEGRFVVPGANPTKALSAITLSAADQAFLSMGDSHMAAEVTRLVAPATPNKAEGLALTISGRLGESLRESEGSISQADADKAYGVLAKNGFTATAGATVKQANSLLATKYATETSEQLNTRRLQAAAVLLKSNNPEHFTFIPDLLDPQGGGIGHDLSLRALFTDATGKDAYGPENPNLG